MRTPWEAYLQNNWRGGSECQVVAALNAWAFYHGHRYCEPDSHLYHALKVLAGAEKGPATTVDKVYKSLGLTDGQGFSRFYELPDRLPLPLRLRV